MKPVCAQCRIKLTPVKTGAVFVEHDCWGASAVWNADMWGCPVCGNRVLVGFGEGPVTTRDADNFDTYLATMREKLDPNFIVEENYDG